MTAAQQRSITLCALSKTSRPGHTLFCSTCLQSAPLQEVMCIQVNKIREVPQHPHIVVTHTDAPQLYVWNLETQPNRATDKVPSPYRNAHRRSADLTAGHVSCAEVTAHMDM